MKYSWHFRKVDPRFKNREATQGEFFASDTDLRAFIREAVQNSLDARRPGHRGPVSVRIFVSGEAAALTPDVLRRYFKGGWDHFHADDCGLRESPGRDEPCRYIVFEDSGTTGLTGETTQYHEVAGTRNPFYYFFRAEGQSNKLETGRGRWGLGKFVFPRSSRLRSFFALTVRHDDRRRLLVGQSILRSHRIDDRSYTPDGWFGEKPDKGEVWEPVENAEFIDQFERDFSLERKRDPGLSIVVPYCDSNWTAAEITASVLQDYYFPILRDELVVTVEDSTSQSVLNAQTLLDVTGQVPDAVRAALLPLFQLSTWAMEQQRAGTVDRDLFKPMERGNLRISREFLQSDVLMDLQRRFQAGERLAVRIPVSVQCRSQGLKATGFDVFLQRMENSLQKRPVFIRDGLIISDVRSRSLRDVQAIVTADDPPLTAFLGDAENPAHTEWHEESSHFKGKYVNGPATLRFVRNAATDLCQLLSEVTDADDREMLLDVFSVGTGASQTGQLVDFEARTSGDSSGGRSRLRQLKCTRRKSRAFRLTRRAGGFRIAGTGGGRRNADTPAPIELAVAYDRRNGSPLKNYCETDFRLNAYPIRISIRSAEVDFPAGNRMRIRPDAGDFEVVVQGFDENRDLFLQAAATTRPVDIPAAAGRMS